MKFGSSMLAAVQIQLTGTNLSRTLDMLAKSGIVILHCSFSGELEASLRIRRADYRKAKQICEKRGDTIKLVKREGIYWPLKSLLRRPVFMVGLLVFLLSTIYLPTRVLFVRVVGNISVPDRMILEAAENCGICFGASRREVRSEKMKNALLEAVPQLQWAGVNTHGCVAEISVRERQLQEEPQSVSGFGHIVAARDGIIVSCNATQGNLLCSPGQAVTEGEILISGYTDCGLSIRAEQAQGEVFAATLRQTSIITPASRLKALHTGAEKKKISVLIGKKRINLWKDSGIWDTTCDRMYEEYYITLPGGFQLPFGWSVERYALRRYAAADLDREEAYLLLQNTAEALLKDKMLSGTIRESEVSFQEEPGILKMTGNYSCVEMIGYMQRLEIGEIHGESD